MTDTKIYQVKNGEVIRNDFSNTDHDINETKKQLINALEERNKYSEIEFKSIIHEITLISKD